MSGSLKTPFIPAINKFTDDKLSDAASRVGKTLPCRVVAVNGGIVQVAFEVNSGYQMPLVTMPVCGSEYYRIPVQIGDLGVAMAVSTRTDNVTGLDSGGTSDLSTAPNLTALVFMPVGNVDWWPRPGNQAVIYGPSGVMLHNRVDDEPTQPWKHTSYLNLINDTLIISIQDSAVMLTVTATGVTINGSLHVTGAITSDTEVQAKTVKLTTHIHANSGGSGNGGQPVP